MKTSGSITLPRDIIVIVGGYGSGKSEVAVNLARYLQQTQSSPVSIADLDIVNPYFRSREAIKVLSELNIKSIVPEGGQFYADLPIILPQIKGAIESNSGKLILDVGGDDAGARVLSSLSDAFISGTYDMLMVVNANRPFTATADACINLMHEIETASRLQFTGLISNSHLMEHTTPEIILEGLELCREVSKKSKLPLLFAAAEKRILALLDENAVNTPILELNRMLLKPWERPA